MLNNINRMLALVRGDQINDEVYVAIFNEQPGCFKETRDRINELFPSEHPHQFSEEEVASFLMIALSLEYDGEHSDELNRIAWSILEEDNGLDS